MAKNKMNLKYKEVKRERNKKKEENYNDIVKSNIKSSICILLFIGVMYLIFMGLGKLGLFDAGYSKPNKEVSFSETDILIGEVFNRSDSEYFVLFDYSDERGSTYIKGLLNNTEEKYYIVNLDDGFNSRYFGEESNSSAQKASDIKINDITLMKVKDGKNIHYIQGNENIIEYLK